MDYTLKKDLRKKYIVLPSWVQPAYSWDEIAGILSNPMDYDDFGRLNYGPEKLIEMGYPEEPQPFELFAGPMGGGVILVHIGANERWLGYGALTFDKGVDLRCPEPMQDEECNNVAYLAPTTYRGWYIDAGKKFKEYRIGASAEHIESMPGSIFWLIGFRPTSSSGRIKGLSEISAWGEGFGLHVDTLDMPPEQVRQETAQWLNPMLRYAWYKVEGDGNGFGYHFAVMLYIGLHLASLAGGRTCEMHLLSSIEGTPKPFSSGRCRWRS